MGRCVKHVGGVNCSDYLVWKKVKLGHFWTRKRAHVARDMFAAFCWRCDRWPFNSKRWTVTHLFFHVDFFLPLWNGPSISCKNGWRCCLKRMTVEYLYRTYEGNNCSLFFYSWLQNAMIRAIAITGTLKNMPKLCEAAMLAILFSITLLFISKVF